MKREVWGVSCRLINLTVLKSDLSQRVGTVQGNSKHWIAQLKQTGEEGRGAESGVWEKGGAKEAW